MRPADSPILAARSIHKAFPAPDSGPDVPVLRGIDVDIHPGEMVTVVGPSGSGKSTLLYCMSGLEGATSGQVSILGRDLAGLKPQQFAELRRDHLGFVFQAYNLIPSLTARDNVLLTLQLGASGKDARGVEARADGALAAVGLSHVATNMPSQLSGGQQQRVAIARALAAEPDILFADEPTGALDTHAGTEVLELLRGYTRTGNSVVMVTHDLEAAALGDRVLVLRDGVVHSELRHPRPADVLAAVTAARDDRPSETDR